MTTIIIIIVNPRIFQSSKIQRSKCLPDFRYFTVESEIESTAEIEIKVRSWRLLKI